MGDRLRKLIKMGMMSSGGGANPLQFELLDEFNGVIAAGSVDGTPADPGVVGKETINTRAVVDTESKMPISNSRLYLAPKTIQSGGDPGLCYGAITRAPGKMLIAQQTVSYIGSGSGGVGWATSQGVAALPQAHALYTKKNGITLFDNNAQVSTLIESGIVNSIMYYAVILRATGAFYYVKGGAYTSWTLLWVSGYNNTATLYPTLNTRYSNFTSDYVHVPVDKWLPTPLISDGFSAAAPDGLGHAEGIAGGIGSGGGNGSWTGATWSVAGGVALNTPNLGAELASGTLTVGTWYSITASEVDHFYTGSVVGDTFRATATTALDANNKVKALTTAELFRTVNLASPDVFVDVKNVAVGTGKQAGHVLRLDVAANPQNFILVYRAGGLIKVVECVGGTYSADILSVANAYAANKTIRVSLLGASVRVDVITAAGGIETVGWGTTNVLTGDIHGMFSTDSGNTFDDYLAYKKTLAANIIDKYARVQSRTGAVLLTFDNGTEDLYTETFAYMASKGMVGTAYINSDHVDTAGYATWAQLQAMDAAGWSIGNHTKTHPDLAVLTQEQTEAELLDCKTALDAHGMTRASMHVAYPGAGYKAETFAAMTATGMLTGRTVVVDTFDPRYEDHQLIHVGYSPQATTTAAMIEPLITEALNLGRVFILAAHDVVPVPAGYQFATAEFRALIDWMAAQGIVPITINDLYARMV